MRKSKIKQISLAVCMAFMPIVGYTAGLGKLNVNSGLGEPLKAEVELLSVTPDELSSLTAAIASEEAYNVQGITRLGIHSNIRVDVAKSDTGAPILKIRSSAPINDPYLDMLIQVDWASGRLLREYTLLLDPPEYKQASNAVSDFSPVVRPNANAGNASRDTNTTKPLARNVKKSQKKYANAAKPEDAAPADAEQKEAGVAELTTKRGDTLAAIAQKMQVEGVSLDQMLVGLFENNKSAFANGNMNQLKVGQIIKAPSVEKLTAIDAKQAKQALKVHASNWNAYRNSLAGNVKTAAAAEENEPKQSASGKIASAEDKSTPVKPGVQDVVKLSAGEKSVANGQKSGTAEADAKVVALQEEAIARENALKESQARAAALEKQIADMQKLLALKSQTMVELQKNAETTPEPAAVKPVVAEPVATEPAAKTEPPKPAPAKPVVKAPPPPVVNPAPEPSFLESLMGGLDMKLLGGTSLLLMLGAGWLFLRNKRRKELDSFERGILTSGGLRANTVFGNTTGNSSTSDTSFLTDFAQSADGSMIDTNDVDPIAEAEVYMAYGRDAQAEEILKDAIVKEPKRYELHLKLLEMYAGRKDVSAFEAVAGELYTTLGADDPTWAKVAEMGAKLESDNPLYKLSDVAMTAAAVSAPSVSASLSDSGAVESELFSAPDVGLDFSLDDVSDTSAYKTETPAVDALGLDTIASETLTNELSPSSAVIESFSTAQEADNGLEFDLGLAEPESIKADELSVVEDFVIADSSDATVTVDGLNSNNSSVDDNVLEFSMSADDSSDLTMLEPELVEPELVNPELVEPVSTELETKPSDVAAFEATSSEVPSFEVPSFLDTAPNIEFASDVLADADSTPASVPSLADATGFEFAIEEPVAIEIPDTPMEVSFNTPLDLDKAEDVDFSSLLQPENAVVNGTIQESVDEDTNFDFSLDSELEVPALAKEATDELASNDFDFSAISLDLGEDVLSEPMEDLTLTAPASGDSESQDVDIKLDLVAAYIDMDDKEGARELLEEVLKEGGPQQKSRAEQLLAGL